MTQEERIRARRKAEELSRQWVEHMEGGFDSLQLSQREREVAIFWANTAFNKAVWLMIQFFLREHHSTEERKEVMKLLTEVELKEKR